MPALQPSPIPRSQFRIGFTVQAEWAWLIASAFLFGSVGAGLFVFSYAAGFSEGALAGLLVVGVLKSTAHMLFLGKPLRAWRAVFAWRTSWLSRGLIAMLVFLPSGLVYLLPYLGASTGGTVHDVFGGIAVASAAFVMVYDGFVLKSCRGIPFWSTWLTPLLVLCYALLGGAACALALRAASGAHFSKASIEWIELAVLAVNLVLVGVYVLTAQVRGAAAQLAAQLLTRGIFGPVFLVLAVGIGLGATLALASAAAATGSTVLVALAAATDLAGHFAMFFVILRAGVYAPPRPLPFGRGVTATSSPSAA